MESTSGRRAYDLIRERDLLLLCEARLERILREGDPALLKGAFYLLDKVHELLA